MPFTGLYIGITPEVDTFTPTLKAIEARALDIAPLYDALYGAFRKIEARRFSSEGPGWKELAPSTRTDRERLGAGGDHPILNRTGAPGGGALRKSLTTKGAKDAVVTPMPDGLFMGTKSKIARYHQDGTHGAGRNHKVSMPARPLVDLTQADAEVFSGIISEWLYGFKVSETTLGNSSSFVAVSGAI